ncbi:MAG: NAD(P)-dependent oxidoreductase [Flavobacteriaceae bacterium CG2_30_34_30]|nr:MAG: NAD(P)-dependent oxidoreductase [Flavobacteriaceae bacterium CG2_30_34_30]PIZ08075.1 MAG: NAD(P)-dependent oxidoreductase [Flavobacteriaceae bacterium CG_4_10_14_0_8_um_filter_34_31]PJC07165.1 MAG: NAD(P)-dependent oxidoreductase [Flavobacteriaceae bacterium CG_4_9_14_0_8_um_filter_34_30]
MAQNVSILGCGWLGFPLAISLIKKGYTVKGTTTSSEKLSSLSQAGILPFLISISEEKVQGNMTLFLQDSSILIINIPPKMRGNAAEKFSKKISLLIPYIEKSGVTKVIFVSSTSVYGSSLEVITEDTPPNPETETGKELVISENLLRNNSTFKTTIIRFGGLIGEDRHPITYLAGRTNLKDAQAPVNLIQQEDCISIIVEILKQDAFGTIFNAVNPNHPKKSDYYTQMAKKMGLQPPTFMKADSNEIFKQVDSESLKSVLNYSFKTTI